jgi:Alr-MurF fusion protein
MISHSRLEINIPNVKHNYNYFRSKLHKNTKLLILVKANAYGLGAPQFAKLVEEMGGDYLAVATVKEGIELKQNGIKLPVLILTTGMDYYPQIIDYGLEPGIPSIDYLKILSQVIKDKGIKSYPVHIKLDTGMHRLGFMKKELPQLISFLKDHDEIEVKSIYSHLAASDYPEHDQFTLGQISLFDEMSSGIISHLTYRPLRHLLNSAGIERFTEYQFDMVRLGIGIYGISTLNSSYLKNSAYFRCPILQIKELQPGDGTVSYGRYGTLRENGITRIATIPVGYADGINRHFGRGGASFELNGALVPTIGNICMDMCMLDVTDVNAKVGDVVTIFGDNPTASDLAKILNTIPYEIFTSVANRVERVLTLK